MNVTEKILSNHLVFGEKKAGASVGIKIDQTLTQDATGTMAYLEFEALGKEKVETELSPTLRRAEDLACSPSARAA